MDQGRAVRRLTQPLSLVLTLAMVVGLLVLALPTSSHATVAAVQGRAVGYHAYDFSLFGGAQADTGPTPTVSLTPDAANSPQAGTAAQGDVQYGPAELFTSGQITVSTEGSLGAGGSVTSSASVQNVNRGGSEVFDADSVQSTCTATEDGVTATTTITNGVLRTHAQAEDHGEAPVDIPSNPQPNHTVEGHLHIGATQDNFRYVFNEQVQNADGSTTVNAVHAYILGPTAVGHLIIGQSTCGVSVGSTPSPTPTPTGTSSPTPTPTPTPTASPTAGPGQPTPPPSGPTPDGPTSCPADPEPAAFIDRAAIPDAHLHNVDCLALLDVIRGFADGTFRAALQVRRDQMAWFIARSLENAGIGLPTPAADRFSDVPPGSAYGDAIHGLVAAGVLQGGPSGLPLDSFGPALRVRRDQMASLLIRTAEYATGQVLADPAVQRFTDVPPTSPHFANVNGAAATGIAQGTHDDAFRPGALVRRDQMSSFIARLLDEIAENA